MSELKGLWCFYIGQGGRQWSKGANADPCWHTHTHTPKHAHAYTLLPFVWLSLALCFTAALLLALSYTLTCTGKHMYHHKRAFSQKIQSVTHGYTYTHMYTQTLLSHPHPPVVLLASVCVSCVQGHQDIPQPAPRLCSSSWNRPGPNTAILIGHTQQTQQQPDVRYLFFQQW